MKEKIPFEGGSQGHSFMMSYILGVCEMGAGSD